MFEIKFAKTILVLSFILLTNCLQSTEIGKSFDKRLVSEDIKEVQEAIKERADLNANDEGGYGALMIAARDDKRLEIIKLLIASGADLNIQSNLGGTPLMIAAMWNSISVAELLIESGADLTIQDKYGNTALKLAKSGKNEQIVKLIKSRMEYLKKAKKKITQSLNSKSKFPYMPLS